MYSDKRFEVKHDHHKSSLADYVGKGTLSFERENITLFDDLDKASSIGELNICQHTEADYGGITVKFDEVGQGIQNIFTYEGLDFGITDPVKQTLKIWVYLNDVDLLMCDHDTVHPEPQKGHATFWVQFAKSVDDPHRYNIQHTFEGSGWHMLEIALNTNNLTYPDVLNMDISEIHCMRLLGFPKKGLELKISALDKYTYTNEGYQMPECPKGGRWLSTCDADAIDGPLITEWYASSFDFDEKVQGSSSLSITGVKGHEDYRCCLGGLAVDIDKENDIFHMDMFVSDINKVLPNDSTIRLSQQDGGYGYAHYYCRYADFERISLAKQPLKTGWNSIDIPFSELVLRYDKNYYGEEEPSIKIEHVVFHLNGASETEEYTLKYDNIYVYRK